MQHAIATRAPSKDWSGPAVVAAIEKHLAEGCDPLAVAGAMIDAADDPARTHPGGIGYLLAKAKSAAAAPAVEEPAWVAGPVRYLPPGTVMCRRHQGEPEHACGKCKVEKFRAPDDPEPTSTLPAAAARMLARQAAVGSRTGRAPHRTRMPAPPPPAEGPAPAPLGSLLGAITADAR